MVHPDPAPVLLRNCAWRRLALSVAIATALSACAGSPTVDSGITRAKLVYVEDDMAFRTRLDEAALARSGCTYESHDPAAMRTLHRLLDASHVDATPPGVQMVEPRYALYLEKTDGSIQVLLFDRLYNGDSRRFGTLNAVPISVEGQLARHLVGWARHASLAQSNPQCSPPATD